MFELLIDKDIGNWGEENEISAEHVRAELDKAENEKSVRITINSVGGNVFEGVAIFNVIRDFARRHPAAEISTYIQGLACSAASIIALAASAARKESKIIVEDNSVFMIHNCWDFVIGNKKDMRDEADFLERVDDMMALVYAAKSGKTEDEVHAMMDEETWLFGDEILAAGFADEVVEKTALAGEMRREEKVAALASARKNFAAQMTAASAKAKKERLAPAAKITLDIPEDLLPAKNSARAEDKNKGGCMRITVDELKKDNPDVYAAILADGEKAGIQREKVRTERLLAMGEKAGCKDFALECIENGANPADSAVIDAFMDKGAAARTLAARMEDEKSIPPVNPPKADKDANAKAMSEAFEKALKNGGSDYGDD